MLCFINNITTITCYINIIQGAVVFLRDEAIHVVSQVSEKLLHLAPQGHFLRGVYEAFYEAIKL